MQRMGMQTYDDIDGLHDRLSIRVPLGFHAQMRLAAKRANLSVSEFIRRSVSESAKALKQSGVELSPELQAAKPRLEGVRTLGDIPAAMAIDLEAMKDSLSIEDGTHAAVAEQARQMLLHKLAQAEQAIGMTRKYLACAPQDYDLYDLFFEVVGPTLWDCVQIKNRFRQLQDAEGQA